ncbi:transposase [Salipaludibacillus sp. CUR1]|uniref:transposase n=1 Tax=Salipaludibacillus sp. CUR1 TaxID=2820003 RepID=UPI001E619755|nr:transposase [Salipaludibacillus sp. CUR1]MCE7791171.1 transposase [Salipaludibacillus sp. CUR1]
MGKEGKNHDPQFREYVAKRIVLDGHRLVDVSRDLGIPYSTLQKWVKRYRDDQKKEEKEAQNRLLTASEYKELYEKERQEKLELQEENEIIKKAMHIFTQEKQ